MNLSKKKRSMMMQSQLGVVLLVAILIIVNLFLANVYYKIDLTKDKLYTLSPASQQVLQSLQDPLTIKVFFSQELPQDLLLVKQDVNDLLAEYENAGQGKVKIERIDPQKSVENETEARSLNIPEIQFNVLGSEKFEVSRGYAGLAMLYQSKNESIPVIQDTQDLEYQMTSNILKMTIDQKPVIGFTSSRGEQSLPQIKQALAEQYSVVDVDTKNNELINDDIDILVIAGPSQEFTDRELFIIDQFLMRGGKLIVLMDGMAANMQTLAATPNDTGLNKLLQNYGFRINNDMVVDLASNRTVTFGSGLVQVVRPYALWPVVVKSGFNQDYIITSKLESLVFPWVSSIDVLNADNKTVIDLAKSTKSAFSLTGDSVSLNPDDLETQGQQLGSKTLAVLATGQFNSYFADKDIPTNEADPQSVEDKMSSTDQGALLIVGDGDFINEENAQQSPENLIFFANALDNLSQNESLISIRSRSADNRPLEPLSHSEKMFVKYGNMALSVLLLVATALIAMIWRKKAAKAAYDKYH